MKDSESQQFRDELAKTIKQAPKEERRGILNRAREEVKLPSNNIEPLELEVEEHYDWKRGKRGEEIYEKSEREKQEWEAITLRIKEQKKAYEAEGISWAKSMASLNDEQLGPIKAIAYKVAVDLARKYKVGDIYHPTTNFTNQDIIDIEQTHKVLATIVDKILRGEKLTAEDFRPDSYPYYNPSEDLSEEIVNELKSYIKDPKALEKQMSLMLRLQKKEFQLGTSIWHVLCQYIGGPDCSGRLEKLPYIFSIPTTEAEKAIRSMLEDEVRDSLAQQKQLNPQAS